MIAPPPIPPLQPLPDPEALMVQLPDHVKRAIAANTVSGIAVSVIAFLTMSTWIVLFPGLQWLFVSGDTNALIKNDAIGGALLAGFAAPSLAAVLAIVFGVVAIFSRTRVAIGIPVAVLGLFVLIIGVIVGIEYLAHASELFDAARISGYPH